MHPGLPPWILLLLLIGASGHSDAKPWRASERNTSGWALMTPKERIEHQATVRAFTDLASCQAYQQRHRQEMEARTRAAGRVLRHGERDFCEHLRPARAEP